MRVSCFTSILPIIVIFITSYGVPVDVIDSANVIASQTIQYPTACGCQTCPCGAVSAVPICSNGVCHTATPHLKRRLFSNKKEVRFYTTPTNNGLVPKWRNYRDRRRMEKSLVVGPQYVAHPQTVTVVQPDSSRCDNCSGYACAGCDRRRSRFHRRPETYRVETRVKKNHRWNRRSPSQTICTNSGCTPIILPATSSNAFVLPSTSSESYYANSYESGPKLSSLEPISVPIVLPALEGGTNSTKSSLVDSSTSPGNVTNTTTVDIIPQGSVISDPVLDLKSVNSTLN